MHFFDKSLSSFLRVTSLKFIGNFKNGIADVFQSFLGCFEPKKILYKFLIFWFFLHIGGHGIFEKSLSSFLRVTSLKFIGNFKNGVADVFQSFLGCFEPKKFFFKFLIFWVFLHIRGHESFWKITKFFFERYGHEIHQKLHKRCCRRILKLFRLFRAKNKFCINFSFFEFFCIPWVMHFFDKSLSSFLRVTGLKFIRNFTKGVADVFQSFLGCFEPKKNLYKFLIFWVFLHTLGHAFFW